MTQAPDLFPNPAPAPYPGGVAPERIARLARAAAETYAKARPKSRAALATGAEAYLNGVPMHWMRDWPQPFPMLIQRAKGAEIVDVDGNRLDDFCLGDTGSMFGHSPPALARAIRKQARRGLTYMLPSQMALRAGALIVARFGPLRWQIATTATDANRCALRVARAVTGRRKILVFNGSYHGTVDEAMVACDATGATIARPGLLGPAFDATEAAVAVEFNDLTALEAALAQGDIAAVLTEPVMTNSCMVLPEPGFHQGLRDLTHRYGTLLILDETHTQSSGLGGYRARHDLDCDLYVLGKCVAGGVACALWGVSDAVALRLAAAESRRPAGHSGMGTTLSGNPLQFACLVATLEEIATPDAFAKMESGAARLAQGLSKAIARHGAPWHVVRVGARVEFICAPTPLRNGHEATAAHHPALEAAIHAALVNHGCLIAPFHNMMLISPATKKRQIDRLVAAFDQVLAQLFAPEPAQPETALPETGLPENALPETLPETDPTAAIRPIPHSPSRAQP